MTYDLNLDANKLLAGIARTYAGMQSYSDYGESVCRLPSIGSAGASIMKREFTTRWKRPGRLHLRVGSLLPGENAPYAEQEIISVPSETYARVSGRRGYERFGSLDDALQRLSASTLTVSTVVPRLLSADLARVETDLIGQADLAVRCELDGRACFCISLIRANERQRMWVDAAQLALLRVDIACQSQDESPALEEGGTPTQLSSELSVDSPSSGPAARPADNASPATSVDSFGADSLSISIRYHPTIDPDLRDAEFDSLLPR
mgnify:CR=1 FL=1